MPGRASRAKVLLVGLALAALSPALLLLLLEAVSYLFGSFESPLQPLRVGSIQVFGRHDPLLFWALRPHAMGPDGTRWINGAGLRGPEIGPKERGVYRILSLGESTTFAAAMAYENSYSALLEQMLNDRRSGALVRVINAGVPGYSLFQGVQFLRHRGLDFEPDLAMLYFGYNDFLPVAYLRERAGDADPRFGGLNDWELFEARRTPLSRLTSFLAEHSNFFRGVLRLRHRDRPEDLRTRAGSPRVPTEHRERLLAMALDFCREKHIELVVLIPIYAAFDGHVAILRAFAAANAVPSVDLPAILPERFSKPRADYFLDAVHPTAEGHRLIAQAIHEAVSPLVE